ncbi:MAG: hypothetical protein WBB29_10380 [Geitlerinemataceae cyanobacterium]
MNRPHREPQQPNFNLDSGATPECGESPSLPSWLQAQTQEGQIVIVGGAIVIGFAIVSLFLKLVSLVLSLALLGGFLYIGYKFLSASSAPDRDP